MTFVRCRGHEVFKDSEMKTKQPRLIGNRQHITEIISEYGLDDYNLKDLEIDNMQKVYRFNKKFRVDEFSFDAKNKLAGFPQRTDGGLLLG